MYRTDRAYYIWLVDVLRQAYMDDMLEAGSPCGCGVGNIIYAAALDRGVTEYSARVYATNWIGGFVTRTKERLYTVYAERRQVLRDNGVLVQVIGHDTYLGEVSLSLIALPIDVIRSLEWEFETTVVGATDDEIMFNRLMACISVLDRYFGIPPVAQEETKESFIKVKPLLCTRKREMELTT